jgi:hypothetical protein
MSRCLIAPAFFVSVVPGDEVAAGLIRHAPLIRTCTEYRTTGPDSTLDYLPKPSKMKLRALLANKTSSLRDCFQDSLAAFVVGRLRRRLVRTWRVAHHFRRRQRRIRRRWRERRWRRRNSVQCLQRPGGRSGSVAEWLSSLSGTRSSESGYFRIAG